MSTIRKPAAAGRFYPADREECLRFLEAHRRTVEIPGRILGAVVPHAGWYYSGATAALAINAVSRETADTIVIFGAVHYAETRNADVYAAGAWQTPLGLARIDEALADALLHHPCFSNNPEAHRYEHAIEVLVPMIQYYMGEICILPISVKHCQQAVDIGRLVATEAEKLQRRVICLASTDLTHYGTHFGFEPHGHGIQGVKWAKDVNDRRFIRLIEELNADEVVAEAAQNRNACGAGAISAAIAATVKAGANRYLELEHITSAEVDKNDDEKVNMSVGYETGVFTELH